MEWEQSMGGILTSISGVDGRCRWSFGIHQRHADEAIKRMLIFHLKMSSSHSSCVLVLT